MSIDEGVKVAIILLACGPCVVIVNCWDRFCTLGRAPHTKETLPYFHEWCGVTRHPRVFRGLTGCQRTLGFWGVTGISRKIFQRIALESCPTVHLGGGPMIVLEDYTAIRLGGLSNRFYRNPVVCFREQKPFVLKTVIFSHLA